MEENEGRYDEFTLLSSSKQNRNGFTNKIEERRNKGTKEQRNDGTRKVRPGKPSSQYQTRVLPSSIRRREERDTMRRVLPSSVAATNDSEIPASLVNEKEKK